MTIECRHLMRVAGTIAGGFFMTAMGTISFSLAANHDFPGNPLSAYALPDGARERFEGRVVERIDAGSYVYLGVERASGERVWVVSLAGSSGAAPGVESVRVIAIGHAAHFTSKRLGRSFDNLYFAVVRPS